MRNILYLFSCVLLSYTLAACGGKHDESESHKDTVYVVQKDTIVRAVSPESHLTARPAPEPVAAPEPEPEPVSAPEPEEFTGGTYSGKLGGKYGVVMTLDLDAEDGYYYYTKYGPDNGLSLTIYSCTGSGSTKHIMMYEVSPDGQTGEFSGTITPTRFSGTMTSYYSGKTLRFSLARIR